MNPPQARPSADQALAQVEQLQRAGRLAEAAQLCAQVVQQHPRHARAVHLLGVLQLQSRQPQAAHGFFVQAIALDPRVPQFHNNLGSALRGLGREAEAAAAFRAAVKLKPDYARALINLARAEQALGAIESALEAAARAAKLQPDLAEIHLVTGDILKGAGRYAQAVAPLERAIALQPQNAPALDALGVCLIETRELERALAALDRALALRPDLAAAHNNRGSALRELMRFEEALAAFERSHALEPSLAAAANTGIALADLRRFDAALATLDSVLARDPGNAAAGWAKANVLLLLGRYGEGWAMYETRRAKGLAAEAPGPAWTGQDVAGKTVLLLAEQGLGDTLQMLRYAPLLARRGARVVMAVPGPLVALCRTVEGVAEVVGLGEPLPAYDLYCSMMSLPLAFGTMLETVPADTYLDADTDKARAWAERLGATDKLRVGLVWSGGFRPDQPGVWGVNARRNMPLAYLAALAHPGVEFHSLQKGEAAEGELRAVLAEGWDGPRVVDHAERLADFTDTAALIANLDLVIAVDTSTAHLAAAMGKPVWLLNRHDTCWRWLAEGETTAWYPTLRLFRQPTPGDWGAVMTQVKAALYALAAKEMR